MRASFQRIGLAGFVLAALITFGSSAAPAAPQALALVATEDRVGLVCQGSVCSAEFTTFCLQPDRFAPSSGTRYRLGQGAAVQLIGTTRDGRQTTLDPQEHLRFESMRAHVALRISMSLGAMDELDLRTAEVAVGQNVFLLPVPEPGDAEPITESEIAVLTGALRPLGARIVDTNERHMTAARITNRMINLLPPSNETGESVDHTLWRQAVDGIGQGQLSPDAAKMSRGALAFCRFAVERAASTSLRRCLQTEHDGFIRILNSEYWDAAKTGG